MRGLPVSCETDENVEQLPPGAALCLYRIAQEALGNAAKHSGRKQIEVRLTRADELFTFLCPMMALVAALTRSENREGWA